MGREGNERGVFPQIFADSRRWGGGWGGAYRLPIAVERGRTHEREGPAGWPRWGRTTDGHRWDKNGGREEPRMETEIEGPTG